MFFMMPYWHIYGKQNLSNEAYRTTPEIYQQKTKAWSTSTRCARKRTSRSPSCTRRRAADVYLIARLWAWWPMLELEKGKTYRLHLMSMDYLHGFSLQPENINIQVHPGYEHVVTITPNGAGHLRASCATNTAESTITRW